MKKILFLFIFSYSVISYCQIINTNIKVDQFGYLPNDKKVAVLADPQTGYNAAVTYNIGTTYEVKRVSDNQTVYTGTATLWNAGATHTQSGDRVAWFDFSALTTPGSYYIYDPSNNVRSYHFEINDCVYNEVLKHAMRTFYYQRCGVPKAAPYAQTGWTDLACHIGTQQDSDCRLHNNTNSSTSKNLSGGWHDAGDYNKYINFTWGQ